MDLNKEKVLTYERLREPLEYNPEIGKFIWIARSSPMSLQIKLGSEAGSLDNKGRLIVGIDNRVYLLHRLAWLYVTGSFPEKQVIHEDENKTNNIFSNLKLVEFKNQGQPREELSQEKIKELFNYNPKTGIFTWRNHRWSKKIKDKTCGYQRAGYLTVAYHGCNYRLHRLAWVYMTGEQPKKFIDHINGNTLDNRWCNLREADEFQNQANRKINKQSKSGYKGVTHIEFYRATIRSRNKSYIIGQYKTAEEAALAYNKRAKELFGEFARLNEVRINENSSR